ncbi:prepilin peptidase [Halanaerobium congolense]|uniref:prepilin peptidase n=1 Tax=Halanaerobium congolense TaxID=54121 RepID=UPI00399BCACA
MGSFLNVVIYRLPEKKYIIKLGPHCAQRNIRLEIMDLISAVSFVINGGKYRFMC